MINNIQDIYSDFRTTFQDNPDFIIEFYKSNSIFFHNIKTFRDEEELRIYIELTCKYVEAVYRKGHLNQAVDLIDKYQPIINKEIERLGANDIKDGWYDSFDFVKGMACYNLRDYKTSTQIFKALMQVDNKNDTYKSWFIFSRYAQHMWIVNIIWIVSAIFLFADVITKNYITNPTIRLIMPSIGFLGIVGNWAYEIYIKRNFRKSSKTH